MKAVFYSALPENIRYIYEPFRDKIAERCELHPEIVTSAESFRGLEDAEVAFSTWGIIPMTEGQLSICLPNLRAVFYAAGSVQHFARPMFARGIRVFCAWHANAVSVAQFAFGQILLALKGYFPVQRMMAASREDAVLLSRHYPGCYHVRAGLLGCGAIGSRVAEMLQRLDVETLVYDPFLPDDRAAQLKVRKTSMEEVFSTCMVVSNHLANLPETRHLIRKEHFLSMLPYSTFINTGRGAQLDEDELYEVLLGNPHLTALLDVLCNDRGAMSNPLHSLANCFITPHIAGAAGQDMQRMGEYAYRSFEAYLAGASDPNEVTLQMLATMA